MTIEEILSPAINPQAPHAIQMFAALQKLIDDAIKAERKRCNRIVQAARNGEIDQDWRSISHRINTGDNLTEKEV